MIYLDHNASSPPTQAHLETLFDVLKTHRPANPSSQHALGRTAAVFLTQARKNLAQSLNCEAREIIFTSGGTEANNLGTRGVFEKQLQQYPPTQKLSIITSSFEHPCILKTFESLVHKYADRLELILIEPNEKGYISAVDVIANIKSNTVLISLMAANNEIGTIQPTKEIADFLHYMRWGVVPHDSSKDTEAFKQKQLYLIENLSSEVTPEVLQKLHFHVDAVQIFGKVKSEDWVSVGYDSFALSGHKVGALQGVGALILRRGRTYLPLQTGGSQEKNRRSGTENIPGIISLGLIAKTMLSENYWKQVDTIKDLTHLIHDELSLKKDILLNSQKEQALPNTVHISFKANTKRAEDVILSLDLHGVCVGSGAACSSGVVLPSHVLLAMGRAKTLSENTIRISLGLENTRDEIMKFLNCFFQLTESATLPQS